jgi:hypothetical protein
MEKAAPLKKRMCVIWFVQCPKDETKKWQFSLHPYIYHKCEHCGDSVHFEPSRTHELRKAEFKPVSGGRYAAKLDEVCDNPTPYFID